MPMTRSTLRLLWRTSLGLLAFYILLFPFLGGGFGQDKTKTQKDASSTKSAQDSNKKNLDPLELAKEASLTSGKIQSAIASGKYEVFVQEGADKEPQLRV